MLSALREGDFSLKPRPADDEDPLGQIMVEISGLSSTLREQRLGAVEATLLLRQVMEEIDVAVFAVSPQGRLSLVNRTGEALLGLSAEEAVGQPLDRLPPALAQAMDPGFSGDFSFPGRAGRWGMKRGSFREGGQPHALLLFTDLSRRLREEERQAWRRLLRVIGHEINNSLAPLKSIAGSMSSLLKLDKPPDDWKTDLLDGLSVLANRVDALSRFIEDYSRIARLPPPQLQEVPLAPLVERVHALQFSKYPATRLLPGPPVWVQADPGQIEQLLINLLKNAIDSAHLTGGAVEIGWSALDSAVQVWVRDEGHGIANPANLFVPFFTTKPGGSGIGLTLSRQIAEAHHGSLDLANRPDRTGALATLSLPLLPTPSAQA